MITFASHPKPFKNHIGVIQRNAIRSWRVLHPDEEIILFGNRDGTEEMARECGAKHIPNVQYHSDDSPLLSDLLGKVDQHSCHQLICYINADIIVTEAFNAVIQQIPFKDFVCVGRRWNIDLDQAIDFLNPLWYEPLIKKAKSVGDLFYEATDYLIYQKGFYREERGHISKAMILELLLDQLAIF